MPRRGTAGSRAQALSTCTCTSGPGLQAEPGGGTAPTPAVCSYRFRQALPASQPLGAFSQHEPAGSPWDTRLRGGGAPRGLSRAGLPSEAYQPSGAGAHRVGLLARQSVGVAVLRACSSTCRVCSEASLPSPLARRQKQPPHIPCARPGLMEESGGFRPGAQSASGHHGCSRPPSPGSYSPAPAAALRSCPRASASQLESQGQGLLASL